MPANRYQAKAEVDIYAKTLLEQLNEKGGIDAVLEARSQMEQIVAYNRSHIDLTRAASDLTMPPEKRAELVRGVFGGASPELASTLGVMAERGGLEILPRVLSSFNELISSQLGVTVVDVVTRVALDDHLRDLIKNKAKNELGGTVVLREQIDTGMLGGIIMSAGSRRIDASMNTMLEGVRTTLKKTS
ncbi:MAG: ATP synthase F1 subunit delta [Eggerthellaceae bacterium]|nr:ATP synthase F1 subunit delta [Eggerthellaceae bacterium]